MSNTAAHEETLWGQPKGLYILFFTEMWERFSYYGMRALLTLYLIANIDEGGFGWTLGEALALYGTYTMMVYLASVPGGLIADRWLGQKKCVMVGGLFLCAGHGVMAIPGVTPFYAALTLIVIGVGLLKPNISTMVGGLYAAGDARRDMGFSIFYMGINVGALASALIVGTVGEVYGWHYGFGLAGIGMAFGQAQFIYGQKYLTHVGNLADTSSESAKTTAASEFTKVERDRIFVLLVSLMIVLVFWGAFEQAGGLMSIYTKQKVDRSFAGIEFPASTFQSLNPLFIILFATGVAGYWHKRLVRKKQASAVFKMAVGTIIMGLGFVFMVLAANEGAPQEALGKRVEAVVIAAGEPSDAPTFQELILPVNVNSVADKKLQLSILISAEADSILAGKENAAERRASVVKDLKELAESATPESSEPEDTRKTEDGPSFWKLAQAVNAKSAADKKIKWDILSGAEADRILANVDDAAEFRPSILGGLSTIAGSITGDSDKKKETRQEAVAAVAEASYGSAVYASTAMFWLILAYLFHTIGELCSSPVALSFITKLSPAKYGSLMMGIYFAVTGLGNKLAGLIGEQVENYDEFTIFTGITIFTVLFSAILLVFLKPLNRLTHGVEEISTGGTEE